MRPMKRSLTALSLALLTICLSGCGSVPEPPEVYQCAYTIKFNKFRCCNTKTKACINLSREDASMEAAQCLSASDFAAAEAYMKTLKTLAEQRCK